MSRHQKFLRILDLSDSWILMLHYQCQDGYLCKTNYTGNLTGKSCSNCNTVSCVLRLRFALASSGCSDYGIADIVSRLFLYVQCSFKEGYSITFPTTKKCIIASDLNGDGKRGILLHIQNSDKTLSCSVNEGSPFAICESLERLFIQNLISPCYCSL